MKREGKYSTFYFCFGVQAIFFKKGMSKMKESMFQKNLKKKLKDRFPGCIITKLDCNDIQGIPDLLILYGKHWAVLENKKSKNASHRPNQDYYVKKMDDMSFGRFIYPENEEEVLNDLQQAFKSDR